MSTFLVGTMTLLFTISAQASERRIINEGGTKTVLFLDETAVAVRNSLNDDSLTDEKKVAQARAHLFIDAVSVGDGKSFCDVAAKTYANGQRDEHQLYQRCLKVISSDDLTEGLTELNDMSAEEINRILSSTVALFMKV